MPTTQPLDEEELGDILEGPLKSIAGFAQMANRPVTTTTATAVADLSKRRTVPVSAQKTVAPPSTPKPAIDVQNAGRHWADTRIHSPSITKRGPHEAIVKTPVKSPEPANPLRQKTYSTEDILVAWREFIDKHSEEHLLINAMRSTEPQMLGNNAFRLSQSRVHLGYIGENLQRLTQYIRNAVQNDNILFVLDEVQEDSPLAWTDRELLKHMVEKEPELGKFIEGLGLRLM